LKTKTSCPWTYHPNKKEQGQSVYIWLTICCTSSISHHTTFATSLGEIEAKTLFSQGGMLCKLGLQSIQGQVLKRPSVNVVAPQAAPPLPWLVRGDHHRTFTILWSVLQRDGAGLIVASDLRLKNNLMSCDFVWLG